MPSRNVDLTEHLDHFIESGIESGRFRDASDVVREGLRLLEQRESEDQARIGWLRSAAQQAFGQIDRGEGDAFHSMEEFGSYIDQLGEEVSAEIAAERTRSA